MDPTDAAAHKPLPSIRDFAARRRGAAALASRAHLDGIVMSAMDAIVSTDDKHDIIVFNRAAEKMFGYAAADILGCPLTRLLPQRFQAAHGPQMQAFSAAGSTARRMGNLGALAACRADGTEFAAEASISQFRVGAGVCYTAIIRDVTERTRILAELQASEERARMHSKEMKNILFAVPAAVCIAHDQELNDITENELYKKWFSPAAPGGPSPLAKHPFRDALQEAADGREVRNYQFSDLKPDGTVRHLLGNAITVWGDDMAPTGAICAFVDVTDLKHAESKVLLVTEGSTAKSDYITHMTHELRTPLGTMLGYAQMMELARPALRADQSTALQQILKAGRHLRGLINEVQQLSTIDARAPRVPGRVDLDSLLDDLRAMITPLLLEKRISAEFGSGGGMVVNGNLQHCKQVMLNLLSNAIKYNRRGGAIFVSTEPFQSETVRIVVRDTGEGLDALQLASLFQPFNRLGQETGSETGTGVGLIVTKRLVESMGGTIGVESSRGLGTSFWVRMPVATRA
jgi:protein-histidine pros-kinase